MKTLWIIAILALLCMSCAEPNLKAYAVADRATYEAIASEYIELVKTAINEKEEQKFTKEQIERRERLIETWRMRIEAGEKGTYTEEEGEAKK